MLVVDPASTVTVDQVAVLQETVSAMEDSGAEEKVLEHTVVEIRQESDTDRH